MTRRSWDELPQAVRAAIEARTGPVDSAEIPSAGRNSDFSATLRVRDDVLFCKGIAEAEGKRGRMHRHEADVNEWLPPAIAPRLRWRAEVDGWLLLGFDRVPGRHADLSPGSPDLPLVAQAVTILGEQPGHCAVSAPRLAGQWARLAAWRRLAKDTPADLDAWTRDRLDELVGHEARAIELAEGDSLVHTDLHALNILVDGERARVVDWAWSRLGNAAIDPAFLIARLIAAGHDPAAAESWAGTIPAWRATPQPTRTAFAVAILGIWEYLERTEPLPHRAALTTAARQWVRYRLMSAG
jgi:phosphotransferase family enzyme